MQVIKRNGHEEQVDFNKITNRLKTLCEEGGITVDPIVVAQKVCSAIHDKIHTSELDKLASEISITLLTENTQYGELAARIKVSDLHKRTKTLFFDKMKLLFEAGKISNETFEMCSNKEVQKVIDYEKDYKFDFLTKSRSFL